MEIESQWKYMIVTKLKAYNKKTNQQQQINISCLILQECVHTWANGTGYTLVGTKRTLYEWNPMGKCYLEETKEESPRGSFTPDLIFP
jgi:hypothetical protein